MHFRRIILSAVWRMDWGFAETGRGRDGRKIKLRIGLSRKKMLVVWTRMVAKGNRNKLKGLRCILLISGWRRNEVVIQCREYRQIY